MKKTMVILLFLIGFGAESIAAPHVEFTANRVHALFVFVEAISGTPNRPPHLKKVFDASKYNNPASTEKLESFKNLDPAFGRFFEFDGLPTERKNGVGVKALVTTQSAFSKDLADFRQRILGQMTYSELNKFMEILAYFDPIYEELIWKPNRKDLNAVVELFKSKSKKWKIDDLFAKTSKFYNSSWPENQNFRISLYPIPKEANLSNGQSFGSFESVGIIIGDKNIEGKFGVVFHELCHSLYDAQSAETQNAWSEWFLNNQSSFGQVTYFWLNEALATALGNGWAYEKAKGKIDKTEWYHHEKIDGLAQGLYPKVVEYLNSGRSVDKNFVEFAVKTFEEKFPQSLSEFETFMTDIVLLTDGSFSGSKDLRRDLRKQFRIQSINSSSPIDHEKSKGSIEENKLSTLFFVVSQKNKKQLESVEGVLPGISKIMKAAPSGQDQIGLFSLGKRRALILLLEDASKLTKAVEWMGSVKKIEKQQEFVKLMLN